MNANLLEDMTAAEADQETLVLPDAIDVDMTDQAHQAATALRLH